MKRIIKKITIGSLLFIVLSLLTMTVSAGPTVESVDLDPTEPIPEDTITFTAEITSEGSIDEAYLLVKECNNQFCFVGGFNQSMELGDPNTYSTTITLTHSDATYIEYNFGTISEGLWNTTQVVIYNLTLDSPVGDDDDVPGDDDDDITENGGNNNTPGFESLLFLGAMIISTLLVLKRKRDK